MDTSPETTRLRQSLLRLLESEPPEDDRLLAAIERRRRPGEPLYSSVLYILTHLSFTEPRAARHWARIVEHRARTREALGRDVGLRVAILDYFLNVNRELRNPKVIEISIYQRTERSALTDGLTGLFNHAYFVHALRREVLRARRHGLMVSLALFDLDDFKRLNDTKGHVAGDRTLVRAAALLNEGLREVDVAARYGGEEFAVVLPDTPREGARIVAERVRQRVADGFRRRGGPTVTVSGGVATFPDDASSPEDLVIQADRALYRSKADGKNRISEAEPDRRRDARHPAHHTVEIRLARGKGTTGRTRNVSQGGILVDMPVPVPVGTRLALTVRPETSPALGFRGEVVRVERRAQADTGRYDVGVRLLGGPGRERALRLAAPEERRRPAGH